MRSRESNTSIMLINHLNKALRNGYLDKVLSPEPILQLDTYDPVVKTNNEFASLVKERIAAYYPIGIDYNSREIEQVEYRSVCMYLMRKYTPMKLVSIGGEFGKHHATVVWAISSIESRLTYDKKFAKKISFFESLI